jgi:hypothetical protein
MKNLFQALAKFSNEVPTIHKGTKGYGYSYADLPTIFNVINPYLEKYSLGVTQLLNSDELGDYITTIVFHTESGETIESKTRIPEVTLKGMNQYQGFGSGVTYYRRYALSCALRLVTDVDNDGSGVQVAKKSPKNTYAHVETVKSDKKSISNDRFAKALEAINAGTYTAKQLRDEFMLTDKQSSTLKLAEL